MDSKEVFNPHVEIGGSRARDLSQAEADEHVKTMYHAAYGEAAGIDTEAIPGAQNFNEPLKFETDRGEYFLHVGVHGDLATADEVVVKFMPWSDDPLRGFEMLRGALAAGKDIESPCGSMPSKKDIALLGVSLPGMGISKHKLNSNQHNALQDPSGGFFDIAEVQWRAIRQVSSHQLLLAGSDRQFSDLKLILAGNSMGASQAVEALAQKPQDANVEGLLLIESLSLGEAPKYWSERKLRRYKTIANFILSGGAKFKDYITGNPYNQYPDLGPPGNLIKQVLSHPSTHAGGTIDVLSRGGDVAKIIAAVETHELGGLPVTIASGSESKLSPPEQAVTAGHKLRGSWKVDADVQVLEGHYHPTPENLGNARVLFRAMSASSVHQRATLHE